MFKFAGAADDGAFAVALDPLRIAAERRDEVLRHRKAERLEVLHEGAMSST